MADGTRGVPLDWIYRVLGGGDNVQLGRWQLPTRILEAIDGMVEICQGRQPQGMVAEVEG